MKYPIVLFLVVLVMRQSQSAEEKDIEQEVKRIVANQLKVDIKEIKLSSRIRSDLGADELAIMEIYRAVKSILGESFSYLVTEQWLSVNDIIKYIKTRNVGVAGW